MDSPWRRSPFVLFSMPHRCRSRAHDRETTCVEVDLWPPGTMTCLSFSEPEPGRRSPRQSTSLVGQEGSATRFGPMPTNGCGAPSAKQLCPLQVSGLYEFIYLNLPGYCFDDTQCLIFKKLNGCPFTFYSSITSLLIPLLLLLQKEHQQLRG
jgi:hypothetical protein